MIYVYNENNKLQEQKRGEKVMFSSVENLMADSQDSRFRLPFCFAFLFNEGKSQSIANAPY